MSQENDSTLTRNKKALAKYLIVEKGIRLTKTKAGKGFMIYNPTQITDIAEVERLANKCDWNVINSPEKRNSYTGEKMPAKCYIGPVSNKLDIKDVDDFMDKL